MATEITITSYSDLQDFLNQLPSYVVHDVSGIVLLEGGFRKAMFQFPSGRSYSALQVIYTGERQLNWRRAFQFGAPEVWAKFPDVFIPSVTIRHPSGATLEARHDDAVFTYGEVTGVVTRHDVEIDTLLVKYGLPDKGWEVIMPEFE